MTTSVTLNQRLGGLLFSSVYTIAADQSVAVQAAFDIVLAARAQIQTADVEYLNAFARNEVNGWGVYLSLVAERGTYDGHTAPYSNFLCLTLSHVTGRRRTTERIRGYPVTELTEDTVFNVNDAGDTDLTQSDTSGTTEPGTTTSYGALLVAYLDSRVQHTVNADGIAFVGYSTRVATGSKKIHRSV